MVTDVREEDNGVFHLWGVTSRGESVLARVPDFEPYFYVSAPDQTDVPPDGVSSLIGALNRCGGCTAMLCSEIAPWLLWSPPLCQRPSRTLHACQHA